MRDEVEEFLRRVAQMRAQAEAQAKAAQQRPAQQPPQPQHQQQRPAPQRMALDPQMQPPPPRLAPARDEVVYLEPADVEVIEAEVADPYPSRRPIGTAQAMAERARRLGSEVNLADDKLAAHLHQVFDHEVGQMESTVTDHAAAAPSDVRRAGYTAGSIVDMLHSPHSIRNAIVLGEVLWPLDERW